MRKIFTKTKNNPQLFLRFTRLKLLQYADSSSRWLKDKFHPLLYRISPESPVTCELCKQQKPISDYVYGDSKRVVSLRCVSCSKYDEEGYDANGYNLQGYDRSGFDKEGYRSNGYNAQGFDRNGYGYDGRNAQGYNRRGFDEEGYNRHGYDRYGYDKEGYNHEGFDSSGYDRDGKDRMGLSISAQTKSSEGCVYFIVAEDVELVKIGHTKRLNERLRQIQANSPIPVTLLGTVAGNQELEKRFHSHFGQFVDHNEWFYIIDDLEDYLVDRFAY